MRVGKGGEGGTTRFEVGTRGWVRRWVGSWVGGWVGGCVCVFWSVACPRTIYLPAEMKETRED